MPSVIQGRFSDFDEFIEATATWEADFRQIGRKYRKAGVAARGHAGQAGSITKAETGGAFRTQVFPQ